MWTNHAWRKQGSIAKRMIEEISMGEKPLERPKLRWEDYLKKDVIKIELEINWR
jgi:hypothetical protein